MIYHHAMSKAVAQEHIRELIAQGTEGHVAAHRRARWFRHLSQWARRLGGAGRKVRRDAHHETSILSAHRQDAPTAGAVEGTAT
jgi:hypothetical protein